MQAYLIYSDGKMPLSFVAYFHPSTTVEQIVQFARKAHPDLLFLSMLVRVRYMPYGD